MKKTAFSVICISSIIVFNSCRKEPLACFNADSYDVNIGQTVTFTSCSVDADKMKWDFGDGNTAEGNTVTHSYSAYGDYSVKHVAETKNGKHSSVAYQTVKVNPIYAWVGTWNAASACGIGQANYTANISRLETDSIIISNFLGIGWGLHAFVMFTNTDLMFSQDAFADVNNKHYDVFGQAQRTGNVISMTYNVNNSAYYAAEGVPWFSDNCTAVLTKQ